MYKFVTIHSNRNIYVTAGLTYDDVTNPDAHVPDRLKINPTWVKTRTLIKQGAGVYPAEITEWNSVKALVKSKVITIGAFVNDEDADADAKEIEKNLKEVAAENAKKSPRKAKSLEEATK